MHTHAKVPIERSNNFQDMHKYLTFEKIMHFMAAGVLLDGLFAAQNLQNFRRVFSPKVGCATSATVSVTPSISYYFSSSSVILGMQGQTS